MKNKIATYALVFCCLLLGGCSQSNSNNQAGISEEEAKTIALEHAGLTADQVTFMKSELDLENGNQVYDIEFYTEDRKEYDYEIHSQTGEIVDMDYDMD